MYIRTIGVLLLVVSGLVAGLPAQSKTFPVSELKPGMVAIGRTVFQGDQLDEFKAHILGVLHNSIGPRRDLILARLEGGPLANTGVIAGMSGSPVYIDGRLVGAVSYSLGEFSKEPIAGITPIEEMIADATLPGQRRAQVPRAQLTLPVTQEGLRDSLRQAFSWVRPFADSPSDVQRHRHQCGQRRDRHAAASDLHAYQLLRLRHPDDRPAGLRIPRARLSACDGWDRAAGIAVVNAVGAVGLILSCRCGLAIRSASH